MIINRRYQKYYRFLFFMQFILLGWARTLHQLIWEWPFFYDILCILRVCISRNLKYSILELWYHTAQSFSLGTSIKCYLSFRCSINHINLICQNSLFVFAGVVVNVGVFVIVINLVLVPFLQIFNSLLVYQPIQKILMFFSTIFFHKRCQYFFLPSFRSIRDNVYHTPYLSR